MAELERANSEKVKSGDFSLLADLHAIISGIKALFTYYTTDGLEIARQCCGGAGFAMNSGVAHKALHYKPMITLEGENIVLYQQTARALLKTLSSIMKGKEVSNFNSYLTHVQDLVEKKCSAKSDSCFENLLEEMLQVRAAYEIMNVAMKFNEDNQDVKTKWNEVY